MIRTDRIKKLMYAFVLPFLIKVLYDHLTLTALPETYIYGISYGIGRIDALKVVLAYLWFVILSGLTYAVFFKPGAFNLLMTALFYLYYLPVNSAFYLNDQPYSFLVATCIYWLLILALVFVWEAYKKKNGGGARSGGGWRQRLFETGDIERNLVYVLCLVAISIGCVVYGYVYNGLDLTLNFVDIYDTRAEFSGSTNMIESFLFNFGGNIAIPLLLLYALRNRKYLCIALSALAQLAIFSIAAQKSQLFVIAIVLAIWLVEKLKVSHKVHTLIPWAFTALLVVGRIEELIGRSSFIFTTIVRRLMYLPSWITTMYFDFFSSHPKLLWTQDICLLGKLGLNRYDASVLEIINNTYFGGYVPSPNAGMFAEAFMHFGLVGVFVYPILFVGAMLLLFKVLENYDVSSQIYCAYAVCMALISIPMTGGVFVLTYFMLIPFTWFCVLCRMYRRKGIGKRRSGKRNL